MAVIEYNEYYKNQLERGLEYSEKSNANNKKYIHSGIERNDNTWIYCIGDYKVIYIMSKNWLQQFKKCKDIRHITTTTSKGYLFPEVMALKYAIKIINC